MTRLGIEPQPPDHWRINVSFFKCEKIQFLNVKALNFIWPSEFLCSFGGHQIDLHT